MLGGVGTMLREAVRDSSYDFAHGHLESEADDNEWLSFQFNPTSLTYKRTSQFHRDGKPAPTQKAQPAAQFKGVRPTTVSFTLLLDDLTPDAGSTASAAPDGVVREQLDLLAGWTHLTAATDDNPQATPPVLRFSWGELRIGTHEVFRCYLTNLTVNVVLFHPDGQPLRATAAVTLQGVEDGPAGTNPTSGAETSSRRHAVRSGQTLQSVAFERYGDSGAWRAIAEANGIDDPLRLRAGTELLLPQVTRSRAAG